MEGLANVVVGADKAGKHDLVDAIDISKSVDLISRNDPPTPY